MKCDFKRVKKNQSTTLDFKYNNLNLRWNSNQPLVRFSMFSTILQPPNTYSLFLQSSMFGNTYDTTQYVCSDASGTQYVFFRGQKYGVK